MKFVKYILRLTLGFLKLFGLSSDKKDTQFMRHDEVVDFVSNQIRDQKISILDVGCGTGNILKKLNTLDFQELHGCDWLPVSNKTPYKYTQVDLNKQGLSKYSDNTFDLLICSDVIEHLENPAQILQEIQRVLKPEGHVILTIPNAWNIQERLLFLLTANSSRYVSERKSAPFGHISFFTTDILESLFDRAGLNLIRLIPGNNYFLGHSLRLPKKLIFSYNVLIHLSKKRIND